MWSSFAVEDTAQGAHSTAPAVENVLLVHVSQAMSPVCALTFPAAHATHALPTLVYPGAHTHVVPVLISLLTHVLTVPSFSDTCTIVCSAFGMMGGLTAAVWFTVCACCSASVARR